MRLYLHRHAIAEEFDPSRHRRDADRALTSKGRHREKTVARALLALGDRFDAIWVSPYRRARETAEIVNEVFPKAVLREEASLAAHRDYADFLTILRNTPMEQLPPALVVVGHEPCLMELSGLLLQADRHAGIAFKKSGIARFQVDDFSTDPAAILDWYYSPRDLIPE